MKIESGSFQRFLDALEVTARASKPTVFFTAAATSAQRTLPIPSQVQVTPGRVVAELELLQKMTSADRAELERIFTEHGALGAPLDEILALDRYPGTHEMAALSDALGALDRECLSPGLRAARAALLFWVRQEIPGGGVVGFANAAGFDDW
jgi:hypothetical protein